MIKSSYGESRCKRPIVAAIAAHYPLPFLSAGILFIEIISVHWFLLIDDWILLYGYLVWSA
jgi:hypothetical protein